MNAIKKMREEMGLNQNQLAIYLGVGRSFLNEVEKANKNLSILRLDKLLQLQQYATQNNRHLINTEIVQQQNDLANFLSEKSKTGVVYKKQLLKKLEQIKINYNEALNMLQTIRTLKNNLSKTATKDLLWCNAIEAAAMQKLQKNNLIVQKKMEMEIEKHS